MFRTVRFAASSFPSSRLQRFSRVGVAATGTKRRGSPQQLRFKSATTTAYVVESSSKAAAATAKKASQSSSSSSFPIISALVLAAGVTICTVSAAAAIAEEHNTKHSSVSSPTLFATSSISTDNIAIRATAADIEADKATVEKIILESGCRVTMIGTAHLSKESNRQVERIIRDTRPDVVMVEFNKSRLSRIGYKSMDDIGLPVVTADDIVPPGQGNLLQDGDNNKVSWWKVPKMAAKNLFLNALTGVASVVLDAMYDQMSKAVENDEGRGGEFKAAIEAAKANGASRVILGDREMSISIRRLAELALEGGGLWGVLKRWNAIQKEEMAPLQDQVKQDLRKTNAEHSDADLSKATMEAMKKDSIFLERFLKRLENEVPEFTQAIVTDREYIMAESIRREAEKGAQHVVGVVGVAHVPGIKRLLLMNKTPPVSDE